MRHRKKFNHLGRKSAHRKAMLSNMAVSLIEHKRIKTTLAKAKALRVFVEPIINRAKTDTTHSRRMVFKRLQSKEAVTELFREVSLKIAERKGGYTRILKTGTRLGDNAEMCFIELVDYNENYVGDTEQKVKKKRTRRGGKKTTVNAENTVTEVENTKEELAEEIKDTVEEENKEVVSVEENKTNDNREVNEEEENKE